MPLVWQPFIVLVSGVAKLIATVESWTGKLQPGYQQVVLEVAEVRPGGVSNLTRTQISCFPWDYYKDTPIFLPSTKHKILSVNHKMPNQFYFPWISWLFTERQTCPPTPKLVIKHMHSWYFSLNHLSVKKTSHPSSTTLKKKTICVSLYLAAFSYKLCEQTFLFQTVHVKLDIWNVTTIWGDNVPLWCRRSIYLADKSILYNSRTKDSNSD